MSHIKKFSRPWTVWLLMALLKKYSLIDKHTKYSVYGWIRRCEHELKLLNIPNGITDIIILYYRKAEIFDIIDAKGIKLSDDKRSITYINDDGRADFYNCYGLNEILSTNKGKYTWDLKIVTKKPLYIWVGIASSFEIQPNSYCVMKGACYVASHDGSGYWRDTKTDSNITTSLKYDTGDKLSLFLDLENKTLRVAKNDKIDEAYTFSNIKQDANTKYRLMITMNGKDNCVEVENFEQVL